MRVYNSACAGHWLGWLGRLGYAGWWLTPVRLYNRRLPVCLLLLLLAVREEGLWWLGLM